MTRQEFETLAIRENGGTISTTLYDTIERLYVSDNEYHAAHGGADESKQEYVKRVFGGKVNTANSVLNKTIAEAQRENRYALQGNPSATKTRLDHMDALIAEHITWEARQPY